jgi:hypothetical protein
VLAGCSQQPVSVPVRSLEQSGRLAFLCLEPGAAEPGLPLDACAVYNPAAASGVYGQLYAMVTQTARGEVALINLSAGMVVDLDPSTPGVNFMPVGALPGEIVTTPGSTAAFVGSAAANRAGIWVLPSKTIQKGSPHLTSFAACALPSPPGPIVVLTEPFAQGQLEPSDCFGAPLPGPHPNGDLARETQPVGTRKLLVALPDQGDLAVIDAQRLLDRPAGSFQACPIETLVHLRAELPAVLPQQQTPPGGWPPGKAADGSVCSLTQAPSVTSSGGWKPHPVSFSLDAQTSTLYVGDDRAPVVHVLDVSSPCGIVERPALLPMSAGDPSRVVYTKDVSVSPPTSDGRKFLYAVDHREGSLMVFDVSPGSTDRTPLVRPAPDLNLYQPPDRLTFAVPVKSVAFALLDNPVADPATGVAAIGEKCDPDTAVSGVPAGYRTAADWLSGAGPRTLRGLFAFAALSSGQVVTIDVDDFDAPCRRPRAKGACGDESKPSYQGASDELSCNVVRRHEPRDGFYMHTGEVPGSRAPGLLSYPTFTLANSSLPTDQSDTGKKYPKMLAPIRQSGVLQIGGRRVDAIETDPKTAVHPTLLFDYREPRAHYDQDWSVGFEGVMPGAAGHVARLVPASSPEGVGIVEDASAYFCNIGVHDLDAAVALANSLGFAGSADDPASSAYQWAVTHADIAQLTGGFVADADPYWPSVAGQCSPTLCRDTFGPTDQPLAARDLRILKAYQGQLVVADSLRLARCCFPMLTSYTLRATNQWLIVGSASGFLHHVVADPSTGRCVDSCDPARRLRNARILERAPDQPVPSFDGEGAFKNAILQFVLWRGSEPSVRDMVFTFRSTGGFVPLHVNLAAATSYVQPQDMQFVPQIGQLAIADGSVQGLMLINLGTMTLWRAYY